ncbi:hypothetical protein ACSAZL_12465 [Methanosarcina sp. T3]|uniref:hypothetical protein n=1 Tax=Methanosarcina sp. T3 TaxID=3439062 RepID=UPI003F860A83
MKKKIIILSLLALCLLTFPASAWEESFENHPNDGGYDNYFNCPTLELSSYEHGYCLVMNEGDIPLTMQINSSFPGQFSFSVKGKDEGHIGPVAIGFKLYNADNEVIFSDPNMKTISYNTAWTRLEFIETVSGNGIDCYANGVLSDSTAYSISGESAVRMEITVTTSPYACGLYLDDFTTSSHNSVVSCDESADESDTYQYFRVGCPYLKSGYSWFYRVYDSELNQVVTDTPISNLNELSIPVSSLSESEYFSIKLFYTYNGNTYFSNSRTFDLTAITGYSLTIENPEVSPGELLNIYCYNASGFTLQCDGPSSDDLESYTISDTEELISYLVPEDSVSGTGVVILRNPSGAKVAYEYFEVVGGVGGNSEISFDKSAYTNSDKVSITYSNLPAGCQVQLTGTKAGSSAKTISETYTKTGSGIFYYQLSGEDISSLYVVAAYDGELLDSDSATVASGDDYVIYGTVYDANTLTAIEGASVAVGGSVVYTDDAGRYDMTTSAGTKNLVVGADGYNTLSTTIDILSISTLKNIYLVPITASEGETGIIYGACADYDTGEAIGTAYIQIANGSVSYSALGRSSTGAYMFEGLPNGSTWTLSASKTGYDNYQKTITVNGSTFHLIRLVSQTSGGSTQPEDDDDSSTERPGRQAARESMEEFEEVVPGLLGFVVFAVFIKIIEGL